jgi:hypothetical protein
MRIPKQASGQQNNKFRQEQILLKAAESALFQAKISSNTAFLFCYTSFLIFCRILHFYMQLKLPQLPVLHPVFQQLIDNHQYLGAIISV